MRRGLLVIVGLALCLGVALALTVGRWLVEVNPVLALVVPVAAFGVGLGVAMAVTEWAHIELTGRPLPRRFWRRAARGLWKELRRGR